MKTTCGRSHWAAGLNQLGPSHWKGRPNLPKFPRSDAPVSIRTRQLRAVKRKNKPEITLPSKPFDWEN
jgi:hypothetical protein